MGTSTVKRTPHRGGGGGGGGGNGNGDDFSKDWAEDAAGKVDKSVKIFLPLLPNGAAKTPIYITASEAAYFAYKWRTQGLEGAIKESGRRIGKEYAVPALVNRSWDEIAVHVPASPLSTYAERSYKRTMTQILNKGVDALAEYKRSEKS